MPFCALYGCGQCFFYQLSSPSAAGFQYVSVDVGGGSDVGVSQMIGNDFEIHAGIEKQGSVAVTETVQGHKLKLTALQEFFEAVIKTAAVFVVARIGGKDHFRVREFTA